MKGDRGEKSPGSTERYTVEKAEMGKKEKWDLAWKRELKNVLTEVNADV